jgi:copper chaperone CopZ
METLEIRVKGMTCEHCVAAVTKEFGRLAGVQTVAVDLVSGGISTVHITSVNPIEDDQIVVALDEAGYSQA